MGNSFSNKYEIPHECQLEQEPDTLQQYFRGKPKLCKWIRKICVVSSNKSHGRIYIKSKYFIEVDRKTHLDSLNYYIIHPFSELRFYWEIFMIIFLFLCLNIVPYCIIVHQDKQRYVQMFLMIMTVVCTFDMVLSFFTGYFERSTKYIVLDPILIAKKYVLRRFFFDIISTFPLDFIFYILRFPSFHVRIASLVRMLRIYTYLLYLEKIRKKRQYSLYKFRCVGILSILIFGINIITCVIGMAMVADRGIYNSSYDDFDYTYLIFTSIGFVFSLGDQHIMLIGYRFFVQFVAIAFGMIIRNIIIVQIMILFKLRNVSQRKYKQLLRELHEYMKFKTLPQRTRERVLNYYKFMFKNMYFNEREIKEQISEYLMDEVRRSIFILWFQIEAFRDCPKEFVELLISNLQRDIYLDGDVIFHEDDDAEAMYFLKYGTVAIYIGNGKDEIIHLEENHFFGDRALLHQKLTYGITVIAVESTEVFKLTKDDYLSALEQFPGLYTEIYPTLLKRKDIFDTVTDFSSLPAIRKAAEAYFHI